MNSNKSISRRWLMLAVGVITMLFAGIIYAWSILKIPFASELSFDASALALNFTLTMCFFCLGGLVCSVEYLTVFFAFALGSLDDRVEIKLVYVIYYVIYRIYAHYYHTQAKNQLYMLAYSPTFPIGRQH